MLNKLSAFVRRYDMILPGDTVVCAVSGGADSVALLFALYLLKDKLDIRLEAAHFNHQLRDGESDRDEDFVRRLCLRYDVPLHVGRGRVTAGKKGLEAAARDARYGFFAGLPGKIATAHTADDNAETVLMHLVRGTGLKGLGGIAPVNGQLIRPMLEVTRREVEEFLGQWCLEHISDSSNDTDAFLRNRIRHHVMPLLRQENPKLAENLSAMALQLRLDEQLLSSRAETDSLPSVSRLRAMHPSLRARALEAFLKRSGVKEPEQSHIALAEKLVFSDRPSARGAFPGGITVARNYDRLQVQQTLPELDRTVLPCPGQVLIPGYRVICTDLPAEESDTCFRICPRGQMYLRSRQSGDAIRLKGGTRQLKKLFIDRKIPAAQRLQIPVLCDDLGILGVCGVGADLDRRAEGPEAVTVRFEKRES